MVRIDSVVGNAECGLDGVFGEVRLSVDLSWA